MGWKLADRPKTLRVTLKLAQEFAEMEAVPHDRPLSERRLQVYERLFAQGGFRPVTWAKAHCKETDTTYRVNGKHTSTMLAGLGTLPEYYVTLEEYVCDTLDDVARLYATFDSKLQARTVNDINRSFAGTVLELAEVSERAVNLTVAGIAYATYGSSYAKVQQPAERAEAVIEHPGFILWLHNLIGGAASSHQHFKRIAVAAAMFLTRQKDADAASVFWEEVRDESNSNNKAATRVLARYLLVFLQRRLARRSREARHTTPDREIFVKCLHAWNAWRKQESTNLNYYADKPVPELN